MGEHTRPARAAGLCVGFKSLVVGRLFCDRQKDHPGIHRDDTEGIYWERTAPPLEWIEMDAGS